MKPNENHDPKLLRQIERRLDESAMSGIPVVDDLAATHPQARADFQQQLENRLLAHMTHRQNGKGDEQMNALAPLLEKRPATQRAYLPLTLAAAMLVVILVGSVLLGRNGQGSQPGVAAVLQETATLTVSPTIVGTMLPNAAPVQGCDTPNATLLMPVNGLLVFEPVQVIGTAYTEDFGFYRFELNGPQTGGSFALVQDHRQPVATAGDLGVFVPSFYQPGEYQFRLTVFDTSGTLRAACTVNIGIANPIATPQPLIPTPVPLVNIVVALQNLPRGFRFPTAVEELENLVDYVPWPISAIPMNALSEETGGLELLLGKALRTDVFREQPILANLIVDNLGQIANVGSDAATTLPPDRVAVSIPLDLTSSQADEVQAGDVVNLSAEVTFAGAADGSISLTQTIVRDALVVHVGDFSPSTSNGTPDIITLAVLPDEAEILVSLIDAQIPLTLEVLSQLPTPANDLNTALQTPTPVAFINVVVARQNLPSGFQFPTTLEALTQYVDYVPWPVAALPMHALTESADGLEQLLGKVLRTDIFREQILLVGLAVSDPSEIVPLPVSGLAFIDDKVAVSIPLSLLTNLTEEVQVGTRVDIFTVANFDDAADPSTSMPPQKIVQDSRVLHFGEFPSSTNTTGTSDIITLAVLPDEAEILVGLIEAEIPLTLELLSPNAASSEVQPAPTQPIPTLGSLVNIVVAFQDLPRGYQFPSTIAELANIAGYAPMPESVVPVDALREDQNGLESLLGQILKTDVIRRQAVVTGMLASDVTEINSTDGIPVPGTGSGQVSVSLLVSLTEILASGLRPRDRVDLIASLLYTDIDQIFQTVQPPDGIIELNPQDGRPSCPADTPCSVTQTLVQNAIILSVNAPAEGSSDVTVSLAVQPQDVPVVNWMLDAQLPYILRPAIPTPVQLPAYPDPIPAGMWLSPISYNRIVSDLSKIGEGDVVDVTFSFLWEAVEPELSNTTTPENGMVITRMVLPGAKVYKLGNTIYNDDQAVTLLLSPEDMTLLSALLRVPIPVAVTITPTNLFDLPPHFISEDKLSLEVPVSAFSSVSDSPKVGDKVYILVSVNFSAAIGGDSAGLTSQLVSQVIARNAEITNLSGSQDSGNGTVTLLMSQEDLPTVQWAIKAGLPLSLTHRP